MYKKLTKDLNHLLRQLESKPVGVLSVGAVSTILDWTDSAKHPLQHVMQAVGIIDSHEKQANTLRVLKKQEKSFAHWAHIISRYHIKLFWVFMLQNSQTVGSDLLQKVSKRAMDYLKKLHAVLKKKSESKKIKRSASSKHRNNEPRLPKKKAQKKSAQKKSHVKGKEKKNKSTGETASNRRKNLLVSVVATLLAGKHVNKCHRSVDQLVPEVIPGDQFKQVLAITVALVYSTANLKWAIKSDFIHGEKDTTHYDALHAADDCMGQHRDLINEMYLRARKGNLDKKKNELMTAAKELSIKPYKLLDWANSASEDTTLAAIRHSLAEYSPVKASDLPKEILARPEDQLFYITMSLISYKYNELFNSLPSGNTSDNDWLHDCVCVRELLLHLAWHHLPEAVDDVNAKGEAIIRWQKFPAVVDVDQVNRLWSVMRDEESTGDDNRRLKKSRGKRKSKKKSRFEKSYSRVGSVSECVESVKVEALDGSHNFFGKKDYVKACFQSMKFS